MKEYNVAILGATGAVGQEMMKVLAERNFPVGNLKLLASARSVGKRYSFGGRDMVVEDAKDEAFHARPVFRRCSKASPPTSGRWKKFWHAGVWRGFRGSCGCIRRNSGATGATHRAAATSGPKGPPPAAETAWWAAAAGRCRRCPARERCSPVWRTGFSRCKNSINPEPKMPCNAKFIYICRI